MLLRLLPVALTLAALAADGAGAPDGSSGLALYSDDPVTRRSTSYIRFGRGGLPDPSRWAKRIDPHYVRRTDFIRFGRSNPNSYIRFGRAGKHSSAWQRYGDDGGSDDRRDGRTAGLPDSNENDPGRR